MQAIDTNILIYAEIEGDPHHAVARRVLAELAEGDAPWAIPWPCVYEFLRVVTHPRVFHPPVPIEIALADLKRILASPSLVLLSETDRHPALLDLVVHQAGATGNLIHDAHIATLCLEHGVAELITGDRDFARFEALKVVNPFTAARSAPLQVSARRKRRPYAGPAPQAIVPRAYSSRMRSNASQRDISDRITVSPTFNPFRI